MTDITSVFRFAGSFVLGAVVVPRLPFGGGNDVTWLSGRITGMSEPRTSICITPSGGRQVCSPPGPGVDAAAVEIGDPVTAGIAYYDPPSGVPGGAALVYLGKAADGAG